MNKKRGGFRVNRSAFFAIELAVLITTIIYFAVPSFPSPWKLYYYLFISFISLLILIYLFLNRKFLSPWNTILVFIAISFLISPLFYLVNHVLLYCGIALITVLGFSLFSSPLVFVLSGTFFFIEIFFMYSVIKKWEVKESFVLLIVGFISFAVLLWKTTKVQALQAKRTEKIERISEELKKILRGDIHKEGLSGANGTENSHRGFPVEALTAEVIRDVLERLRSITRAEFVYFFRPITSTGLRWHVAAFSAEYEESDDVSKDIDGGWEPIKVPYLLGKEFQTEDKEYIYRPFPFQREAIPESLLSLPVFFKGVPVAVLYLEKHFPGPFSRSERESVAMGADFISQTLTMMNLITMKEGDTLKYSYLNEYIEDMLRAKKVEDIFPSAARHISNALAASCVFILVREEGTDRLKAKGVHDREEKWKRFDTDKDISVGGTIIQWCMENEIHRIINYREKGQRKISNLPETMFPLAKGRSVIIYPFYGNIEKDPYTSGVVFVTGERGRGYMKNDIETLKSMINVTHLALPRAFDYDALEGESRRDPLTGLYNRKELFVKLRGEISKAKRLKSVVSFLLLDIDNFKKLNDAYGHMFGDDVLVTTARIMQNIVRPYDTVGRYGGEEFSIVLFGTDKTEARKIADRIRVALKNKRFERRGKQVTVTVSIGCATFPNDSETLEGLVELADKALYHSKESGRDRVSSVHDFSP